VASHGVGAKIANVICAQNFFGRVGTKPILQVTVTASQKAAQIDTAARSKPNDPTGSRDLRMQTIFGAPP